MERTEVVLGNVRGEIQLFSDDKKAGKMDISVIKDKLTVYHTEVNEEFEGRGFAKILLEKLVPMQEKISSKLFRCVRMFTPSSNAVPTNTAMYGSKKNCKILKL